VLFFKSVSESIRVNIAAEVAGPFPSLPPPRPARDVVRRDGKTGNTTKADRLDISFCTDDS
jgi:hypothetical protein